MILIVCILAVAVAWFMIPYGYRLLGERRLRRACIDARAIALTYDDGPGPVLTPKLLDLLKARNAPGTFFPLGSNIRAHEETAARLVREEHEIGNHTFDHTNAWKANPLTAANDFQKGRSVVESLGGDGSHFRPPYGKLTLLGLLQGLANGTRFAWWTIDTRDSWKPRSIGTVLSMIEKEGGGVVLMHDFDKPYGSGSETEHAQLVLEMTDAITKFARENNYKMVLMRNLFAEGSR